MIGRSFFPVSLAITIAFGMTTACGGADALAPSPLIGVADTTVVGSWLMESVNGQSLPYYYTGAGTQGGIVLALLDGGTLRLERDGTFSTSLTLRGRSNIPQIQAATGTFTADHGVVTLRSAGATTLTGTATAHSLMLAGTEANGIRYAFAR